LAIVAGLLGTAVAGAAEAPPASQEDQDLELIPPAAEQSQPAVPERGAAAGVAPRLYVENAFTTSSRRDDLAVAAPPPPPFDWQERLLLDARQQWDINESSHLYYSGRLNLRAENDISAPDHENLINDLREAYVSLEPFTRTYFDVGRINFKSGVALGYNPTDYFKARAVVEPLSTDPTVLREDRLGTVMLRAERIWEGGSLTAAFAPELHAPSPIYTNLDLPSFDPMLDRTNAWSRILLKGSFNIAHDFSPEFLLIRDGSETKVGANLTQVIGQRVVGYAEWSGGRRTSVIDEARQFGRETGTLPATAPSPLPDDGDERFVNELAVGASYTLGTSITLNLEYHWNAAGVSSSDWNQWFAVGGGRNVRGPVALELWYIRDYALDQQELFGRHAVFLRMDWVDAIIPKLELAGLVDVDPRDGSALLQLSADFYLADKWTVGGLFVAYVGGRLSDFGSLPQQGSVLMKITRYF
jgi:hypothetical protein